MNEIFEAIKQICKEKNLSVEVVIATIEQALAAAYRKDFGQKDQNIKIKFDPETGEIKAFDEKTVVDYGPEVNEEKIEEEKVEKTEEKKEKKKSKKAKEKEVEEEKPIAAEIAVDEEKKRFNPKLHLTLEDAKKIKKGSKVGDEIITELEVPAPFGRMAAQTAKQVIIQRLREAERDVIFNEFKNKESKIVAGIIQRIENRRILVDLGKTTAVLPLEEQVRGERYSPGQRIKVFIVSVNQTPKGPEMIVSRTHPEIIRELFTLEIPEIANKTVEIKSIAREAGSRSKVAVSSSQDNLDPIGACIGQRGSRIQTIIAELGGEKIDIIEYSEDPNEFIAHALLPAKVNKVEVEKKGNIAKVEVREDQLSLAIGKGGQNVRLASRLTGWTIEIKGDAGKVIENAEEKKDEKDVTEKKEEIIEKKEEAVVPENSTKTKEKKSKKKKKEEEK